MNKKTWINLTEKEFDRLSIGIRLYYNHKYGLPKTIKQIREARRKKAEAHNHKIRDNK